MRTVADFAIELGVTPQSLNSKIRKLSLDLSIDPMDQRKRLLSEAQCELLREYYPRQTQTQTQTSEVMHQVDFEYKRPTEIGLVLAQRSVAIGSVDFTHQNPMDNPLLQRMRSKVEGMQVKNDLALQRLTQSNKAGADLEVALDAYEQLGIVEEAQARADRNFFLGQQAYNDRVEKLRIAKFDLGNQPQTESIESTPQTQKINADYPF